MLIIAIFGLISLIAGVIIFNINLHNLLEFFKTLSNRVIHLKKNSDQRLYLKSFILISIFTGVICGFSFKSIDFKTKANLLNFYNQQPLMYKNALEIIDDKNGFFSLQNHDYSWLAFILGMILSFSLLVYLKNNASVQYFKNILDRIDKT